MWAHSVQLRIFSCMAVGRLRLHLARHCVLVRSYAHNTPCALARDRVARLPRRGWFNVRCLALASLLQCMYLRRNQAEPTARAHAYNTLNAPRVLPALYNCIRGGGVPCVQLRTLDSLVYPLICPIAVKHANANCFPKVEPRTRSFLY